MTYDDQKIAARLQAELPNWTYAHGYLRRTYKTKNWKATMMLVNAIGYLAETAWHHPDLLVSFSSVELRLMSHDAGGITDKDFELAAKIQALVGWKDGNRILGE
ncbi:pterin-4-alpha-carbinolamine dehydratase [Rhodomicrobium udaipurense JA643]|uniref:4a-hydroxytetrahydrobiopterin dehydratase n=1 Tax=Rhodomicrobium udaipurense TaxID=1202716 RepID=A0A8I1GIZ8_9HYPH|nr:4a-hydroxytetrahydrobiopterin dehydratase [Rhodomicrobium udaipurense]KAI94019.1 pterin-4-alpha-carbinolamine dehydratase [Rhodomicrobium udaipurense JA643]MBJ7544760.1 4a-hydroxytetrahydrobiopterin dehydratase [Rhodomicrobium udaipurense]